MGYRTPNAGLSSHFSTGTCSIQVRNGVGPAGAFCMLQVPASTYLAHLSRRQPTAEFGP